MPAQRQKAEDRDILVPANGGSAGPAARTRGDDRLPGGNAIDADIEKGADDGAQDESDRQNHYNCHEISNPKRSVSIAAVTSPTEMSERHLALIGQGGV